MDQMNCDKIVHVSNYPDGKKFVMYNALKLKIDQLQQDHGQDANLFINNLMMVLNSFSNMVMMPDPMTGSALDTTDISGMFEQLRNDVMSTNSAPTELQMELIESDINNISPVLTYEVLSKADLILAHEAFMPFVNMNINMVPFYHLGAEINHTAVALDVDCAYQNAFTYTNTEIYDMGAEYAETAHLYQMAWDLLQGNGGAQYMY